MQSPERESLFIELPNVQRSAQRLSKGVLSVLWALLIDEMFSLRQWMGKDVQHSHDSIAEKDMEMEVSYSTLDSIVETNAEQVRRLFHSEPPSSHGHIPETITKRWRGRLKHI